jgi:hypothetical protein
MAPTVPVLYTPIVGTFPQIIPSFFPSTAHHGSLHTHSNLHPAAASAALYVLFSRERNDDILKHHIQQKLQIPLETNLPRAGIFKQSMGTRNRVGIGL